MRLLSFNIHGHGTEPRALAEGIARLSPDIIALQEVTQSLDQDLGQRQRGSVPLKEDNTAFQVCRHLEELGERYHLTWLGFKKGYDRFEEGLAFLTKTPPGETDEILLSKSSDFENWKTRMALGVRLGKDWFYNLHLGRWDDAEESFPEQWDRLQKVRKRGVNTWLLGDFNAPAEAEGEGYETVLSHGWKDTFSLAERTKGNATVTEAIDGWRDQDEFGARIDYIFSEQEVAVTESAVVFDGVREPMLSDHFGVMVTAYPKRGAGILLPITALPSPYGIGCFSKEAYRFIDWLCEAGQSYWQILPLGPTGYGDSPYQSFSTFAGNPYLIDLETLIAEGLLTKEECDGVDFGNDVHCVDYEKQYHNRCLLLKKAEERYPDTDSFLQFCKQESDWLEDYVLFMAVKATLGGAGLEQFPKELRQREPDAVDGYRRELAPQIRFWKFVQFTFFQQWKKLKAYANRKGIRVIGDLPVYVAMDSSDVWANPELFQLDAEGMPTHVAGCPPDGFSAEGQLWGNPVFRWEKHRETKFSWWLKRLRHWCALYDLLRIDHFRGFDAYYEIPYGSKTAVNGVWKRAEGRALFQALKKEMPNPPILAEDLGFLTDSVRELLEETGFPGMKILQFGFDARDTGGGNEYLPHTYPEHCVAYTGTHDNATMQEWLDEITPEEKKAVRQYLWDWHTPEEELHLPLIALLLQSRADTVIVPLQDYLGLGHSARINTPATAGNNWCWRMEKNLLSKELAEQVCTMTKQYGR